eukprot:2017026-Prymnesium_polylepis.1
MAESPGFRMIQMAIQAGSCAGSPHPCHPCLLLRHSRHGHPPVAAPLTAAASTATIITRPPSPPPAVPAPLPVATPTLPTAQPSLAATSRIPGPDRPPRR